ncbi:acetylxylan esterase [Streptacidiphilus sp. ASG 303]|uniref:acetylxylan esterase n=1 Tax=Streptacidiphilus sp. ASG 303 TaxID=2896847 RepID=UPI001E5E7E66|nr:acetylxylan esterase [Streptacidiphilus sp. ASG 303]MCD0483568.1 acetylxylan esterase [Streptacidiphilus sp. ASG 303]
MYVDMPLDELRAYRPARTEPEDFDAFWKATLDEARAAARPAVLDPVATRLTMADVFDVTFTGFAGQSVKAWLWLPRGHGGPLPCIVEYLGYGGGRGPAYDMKLWPAAGYAHLIMDSRGQSSHYGSADTPDLGHDGSPQVGGFTTRGIRSPHTHYYRRLFTDAVRAVDTARTLDAVDPERIVVKGGSQGGGIALAAAGLSEGLAGALVDVPFLCGYRRATEITDEYPYREIADYLRYRRDRVEETFHTLSYLDGINFAARADAPAMFSVGLMDAVCPPSTVFAAYNHWAGTDKDICVWTYNGHDGGAAHQTGEHLDWLARVLG